MNFPLDFEETSAPQRAVMRYIKRLDGYAVYGGAFVTKENGDNLIAKGLARLKETPISNLQNIVLTPKGEALLDRHDKAMGAKAS